jgi:hypothetical protein
MDKLEFANTGQVENCYTNIEKEVNKLLQEQINYIITVFLKQHYIPYTATLLHTDYAQAQELKA